jgi:hypothetical protein
MPEFMGSAFQIEVQKRMLARHDWIKGQVDVANGGRVMNFLEPAQTGWDVVGHYLREDGVVALNAQERRSIEAQVRGIFGAGYEYPTWDVYLGAKADVLEACRAHVAATPVPDGWRIECLRTPDMAEMEAVQALNMETGVAPYPGFYMRSEVVPSLTACLWDADGALAATSAVNARFHPKSRFGRYIFKGSTSVKPTHQGLGLGKLVNAHVLIDSQVAMGWIGVLSQVSSTNIASQKTISAAGLRVQKELMTVAVVAQGEVFTR